MAPVVLSMNSVVFLYYNPSPSGGTREKGINRIERRFEA
jgi:hypothetical protein